jgi:hypothetical protein
MENQALTKSTRWWHWSTPESYSECEDLAVHTDRALSGARLRLESAGSSCSSCRDAMQKRSSPCDSAVRLLPGDERSAQQPRPGVGRPESNLSTPRHATGERPRSSRQVRRSTLQPRQRSLRAGTDQGRRSQLPARCRFEARLCSCALQPRQRPDGSRHAMAEAEATYRRHFIPKWRSAQRVWREAHNNWADRQQKALSSALTGPLPEAHYNLGKRSEGLLESRSVGVRSQTGLPPTPTTSTRRHTSRTGVDWPTPKKPCAVL